MNSDLLLKIAFVAGAAYVVIQGMRKDLNGIGTRTRKNELDIFKTHLRGLVLDLETVSEDKREKVIEAFKELCK